MHQPVNNIRIRAFEPLDSPDAIGRDLPITPAVADHVRQARLTMRRALAGEDKRLVVISGPCSIHDPKAAVEYAQRLAVLQQQVAETLIVVMRVYFEKPRTTVGWKGLINDPLLDGSCQINLGLRRARQLLLDINALGLPCATEFLDPIVPQYLSDLVSWTAIGARTTESQTHREMASGLSMPVGFKNATDGALQIALDGMVAAQHPHAFLGINRAGDSCIVRTAGNPDVHLVLRGGSAGPNYTKPHIAYAKASLEQQAHRRLIMVDCSHGNSNKDYRRQGKVFEYMVDLFLQGEDAILGMMVESNLVAGQQAIGPQLTYGQSVTDACIDWQETERLLLQAQTRLKQQ